MREPLKRIVWHGDSLERIRLFPSDARQDAGYELERVQRNLEPRDWRPMSAAGAGVIEIRVHVRGEYRIFYIAKLKDAVHVLHAFVKKTQKTRRADIELAARRYREAVEE